MAIQQPLHRVFVYGSLMADEVVSVLLKRVTQSSPAILNDHQRFSIRGRVYPAILPVHNKQVTGKDSRYERKSVDVISLDNSEKLQAYAYVWKRKDDPDLYGDWDFEVLLTCDCKGWKQQYLEDYLKKTKVFAEENLPI